MDQTARGFRLVLSIQSWLGVAVLLCAILMALFASLVAIVPNQNTTTGASSDLLSRQTKPLGNLSITLTVTPGKINVTNTVTVQIRNRHSGQFAMNAHIIVSINMDQMDMGTTQATMMRGTQAYSAIFAQDTTFSMTGIWDITLTIQLPQQVQGTILFQVWLG
jgi:hypothetical protein